MRQGTAQRPGRNDGDNPQTGRSDSGGGRRLLLISATDSEVTSLHEALTDPRPEAAWPRTRSGLLNGVPVTMVSAGIGKANTAAAVAALGVTLPLVGVLQIGIGGSYPNSGLALGQAVVAAKEVDLDLGSGSGSNWRGLESLGFAAFAGIDGAVNEILLDQELVAAVAASASLPAVAFGTSDTVTADTATAAELAARHGLAIESMEGVAAAQVALELGLPFVEVRAVSNLVGDRDRSNWRIANASTAACAAGAQAAAVMWQLSVEAR